MIDSKKIEEVISRLIEAVPAPLKEMEVDLKKEFHRIFQQALSSFDLVQREEFDIQKQVLAKTREKLEQLEHRVTQLEQQTRDSE